MTLLCLKFDAMLDKLPFTVVVRPRSRKEKNSTLFFVSPTLQAPELHVGPAGKRSSPNDSLSCSCGIFAAVLGLIKMRHDIPNWAVPWCS